MDLPLQGRIDIHSHVLPGIDDGCPNLVASLRCIRKLKEQGYVGTICTPHYYVSLYPHNTPDRIAQAVADLEKAVVQQGLEYRLWSGGEVRLDPETIDWFEAHGVPTLGESRYVLVDFWGTEWPKYADEALDWLKRRKYVPLLAHPERMGLREPQLVALLDRLQAEGVLCQGNFNSISGGEGEHARHLAERFLDESRYVILATDMHHPDHLHGRFRGIEAAAKRIGTETAEALVTAAPRAILTNLEPAALATPPRS